MTTTSGRMASRVRTVSSRLSPFVVLGVEALMLTTSAPSRLAASSKVVRVRVEVSKNRLSTVRPVSRSRRLSIDWILRECSFRKGRAGLKWLQATRPSMPSKWGNLGTPARFFVTKALL